MNTNVCDIKPRTDDHASAAQLSGCPMSRRGFLGAMGAGAVAPAVCMMSGNAQAQTAFVIREDRFSRMFPTLAPFARTSPELTAALTDIGKPGGMMDANDALDRGPVDLIIDPALSVNNPDNAAHTAGTTFVGQFVDHDITFDLNSRLGIPTSPESSPNSRTPALDLDSVYGGGPSRSPELYGRSSFQDPMGNAKLLVESGGLFEDLPRAASGTAILGDPRNDENAIISGLHAAFLLFHNNAVDLVHSNDRRLHWSDVFREARRLTTWHYQWIVLRELLPQFVGQSLVDEILNRGRRFYRPSVGVMPVEFQGAAYRFGHSMVRPSYRLNLGGDNGAPFFGFIFDPSQEGAADPNDLRGGSRAMRRFVGWQTFFNFGDGNVRPNKRIDTTLSTPLFHLPLGTIASRSGPTSLPVRNLLRHVTWQLPSGQSIARAMGVARLSSTDLGELQGYGLNLERSTPLFYYILKEALLMTGGSRLGPVGGRIVAEVLIGLMQLDRAAFLRVNPRWRPTLRDRNGQLTGDFRMVDFLTFAGVSPSQRGQ